jgi:FkbM family methyltransferase
MYLDYIEIGTSDFDTLLQSTDLNGISIDPLSIYLERLPNKINNEKLNVAISDFNGECDVFYINPEDIEKYNLPDWLRGCNSILNPHPSALHVLNEFGLGEIYQKKNINVLTWDSLIRTKNITGVDYLKIDTEGHDPVIIKSILDSTTNILPKKIKFETNILTPDEVIYETINLLKDRGYKVIEQNNENTLVEISENIIDKIIFSSDANPEYIEFWVVNSLICSKKLKITPVLFYICDEDSDFYWDEFGLVKKIKHISDNSGFESQIFRMYGTRYFPKDLCLTNDIDMILFNKDYLSNKLFDRNSITILNSDAYDSNRPECVGVYSGPDRYAICYVVATGEIFNRILNTDVSFEEYYTRLLNLDKGWDADEIYFGTLVNRTDIRVNKIKRGIGSHFHVPRRIEKHNFYEEGLFKINLNGFIEIDNFIDCHCARPYSKYKKQIDNLIEAILK